MRTLDEARNQFSYHPATEETARQHAAVRDIFRGILDPLWHTVPDGPEKTLMFRALQESQMYANLAIALTAPADESETRAVARVLPEGGEPRDFPVRDVRGPIEETAPAPKFVRVTIDGHGFRLNPGTWSTEALRASFGVASGRQLWIVDPGDARVALHNSETVKVQDGMVFVTGRP